MNLNTFNEMPPDLQEVMLSASRVQNLDLSALTIPTDARGRKVLADGGMETIMIPDEDLKQAADWCWERFVGMRGKVPHIDKMIDIYTEARKLYADYYGPKRLPSWGSLSLSPTTGDRPDVTRGDAPRMVRRRAQS